MKIRLILYASLNLPLIYSRPTRKNQRLSARYCRVLRLVATWTAYRPKQTHDGYCQACSLDFSAEWLGDIGCDLRGYRWAQAYPVLPLVSRMASGISSPLLPTVLVRLEDKGEAVRRPRVATTITDENQSSRALEHPSPQLSTLKDQPHAILVGLQVEEKPPHEPHTGLNAAASASRLPPT